MRRALLAVEARRSGLAPGTVVAWRLRPWRVRRLGVATAALVAVLLVAACGGDGDDERAGPTTRPARGSVRPSSSVASPTVPSSAPGAPAPAPSAAGAPVATTAAPSPGRPAAGAVPRAAAPAPSAAAPSTCPPVPVRRAPAPDRPRYRLHVEVRTSENAVAGDLAVRFTPDRPTDRLVFRLWPNGPKLSAAGARLETGTVTVGGRPAAAQRPDPTTLVVPVTGGLAAGRSVDVALPWRLTLPGQVNDRVSRSGDAVRLGSFFPILSWEPGIGWATDPPTVAHAEASTAPVADFDVSVVLPAGVSALATGEPDGAGRWRAAAVRDWAMSVGRFRVVTGTAAAPQPVRVTVGVDAAVGDDPSAYLAREIRALEDFGNRLGPYPWPSLTLALTPGLTGGIEYPAHIMQGPGSIGRSTPHEVAHQWFYALVGNDQGRDPWLDEGLATYAEARHEGTLPSIVSRSVPADARGRAGEPMTYWDRRTASYYRGVYVQGAQALAAAGDPGMVDCALRHYVARLAHAIARPVDLLDVLDAVLPGASARMARFGTVRR